jgi:hypothetical protein
MEVIYGVKDDKIKCSIVFQGKEIFSVSGKTEEQIVTNLRWKASKLPPLLRNKDHTNGSRYSDKALRVIPSKKVPKGTFELLKNEITQLSQKNQVAA